MDKERLIAEASRLLDEGYDGVLGLRRRWGHIGPYLFTSKEELPEMETEPRYMLAATMRQLRNKWPEKKFGLIARGCDERALKKLEEAGLFEKDGTGFIGIVCSNEQAEECNCEKPIYETHDCSGCWKCMEACEKDAI